jgi:large subunit ribosomal protein L10
MALTKVQKDEVIKEVTDLLNQSKMTVIAKYQGIDVKSLQKLRREATNNGTRVKVVKNRLVKQAILKSDKLKQTDTAILEGMLLYAFNGDDEVAAAQVLNTFAKQNPSLEFVGAISDSGEFLEASKVKELAGLPGKEQLIAGLISTLSSPVHKVINSLGGNLHGMLSSLEAKASN